jgi:hypothetical protein
MQRSPEEQLATGYPIGSWVYTGARWSLTQLHAGSRGSCLLARQISIETLSYLRECMRSVVGCWALTSKQLVRL